MLVDNDRAVLIIDRNIKENYRRKLWGWSASNDLFPVRNDVRVTGEIKKNYRSWKENIEKMIYLHEDLYTA